MTNNNIKEDERVVELQRKIGSDTYQLVSIFLLASIVYKQFILITPFSSYMTELIAFLGGSAYVVFKNIMIGNDINAYCVIGTKNPTIIKYLFSSLISSLTITTLLVINDYTRYQQNKERIFIIFLCMFSYWFLSHWGLNRLSKKRVDKIAKQYEDK
ncbi:hypothetical protein K9O30_07935 [Clostridium bowmanii]|uniref:DUF6773 family protein n=1 Tax=Clostridium bowmanii TaxID=132925 RepID=UPI001C0DF055|nr:DUF6773 family protein [Clostridium bowmanii]MBU3188935.1 hypothetical protein [Clostridium bowmanii]MCA1073656.1 hypothetical protein [Clostridium bowmanii]